MDSSHLRAPPAPARPRHRLLPVIVSAVIAAWQISFLFEPPPDRFGGYANRASVGLSNDAGLFFYFFYHLGQFPVGATEVPELGPRKQDALAFVLEGGGDLLRMDFDGASNLPRFGDYATLFLFYPDTWIRQDPAHARILPFNAFLFIASLLAVVWAFWFEGHALLGVLIAILVGSDPFQIFETYGRGNIFSIPISITLLALSAHLRYLTGRKGLDRWAWLIAIAAGAVLATVRDIRTEAAIIAVSVAATYLLIRSAPLHQRALLLLAFVAAFALTQQAWKTYWMQKFERAEAFVAQAGGVVYRGPLGMNHAFWHAVFCGLGDYGADKGFEWDDRVPFQWATKYDPVTNPHPLPYHYSRRHALNETHDGIHRIAPTDLPEYNRLVRDRVLYEIRRDPLWYAEILGRRLLAVMADATPASLAIGQNSVGIQYVGWLLIPALILLLWQRRFFQVKLILFTVPLSAVAVMVFSGKGMTYYGIAHLIALATCSDLLVRHLLEARKARSARPPMISSQEVHVE